MFPSDFAVLWLPADLMSLVIGEAGCTVQGGIAGDSPVTSSHPCATFLLTMPLLQVWL